MVEDITEDVFEMTAKEFLRRWPPASTLTPKVEAFLQYCKDNPQAKIKSKIIVSAANRGESKWKKK